MTADHGRIAAGTRRLLGVAAAGVGTALALVVAEVVLRVLGLGYGNAPLESSRELHHVHPTNFEFVVHSPGGEYGGFTVRYDEIGARVAARGGSEERRRSFEARHRVVFLGDSFTEANQVVWEDSFVGRISSANPDVEVYNLGVSSYSPLLFLIQARRVLDELDPTHLVVQVYANDFGDDRYYLSKADSREVDEVTRVDGGPRRLAMDVLRRSYVARLVRRAQLDLEHRIEQRDASKPPAESLLEPDLAEAQVTFQSLETIAELASAAGVELLVMYIPNKFHAVESRCCDDDVTYAEFDERLATSGITTADLASAFAEHPDQPELFFVEDMHLSPEGHRVVAEVVAGTLGLSVPD